MIRGFQIIGYNSGDLTAQKTLGKFKVKFTEYSSINDISSENYKNSYSK